jgi:hypothetical protein
MKESAMRVTALTAGLLLTTAMVAASSLAVQPAMARQTPVACPRDSSDDHKVRRHAAMRPVTPAPRRAVHRIAQAGYYNYRSAAPISREWHGAWRVAPNDAYLPGPSMAYYGPPPVYRDASIQIDPRAFDGGVGNEGGGGGGGGGDIGQIHFANGGSVENGPTYNDYNQSFQFNPSQAAPFQPRLMGGFAPPASTSGGNR